VDEVFDSLQLPRTQLKIEETEVKWVKINTRCLSYYNNDDHYMQSVPLQRDSESCGLCLIMVIISILKVVSKIIICILSRLLTASWKEGEFIIEL